MFVAVFTLPEGSELMGIPVGGNVVKVPVGNEGTDLERQQKGQRMVDRWRNRLGVDAPITFTIEEIV